MKIHLKLFSIILSVMLFILSVMQCSLTVQASSSGIHTDKDKAILNKFFEDGKYFATYCITQLGAIFSDYSFSKVMENKAAWNDYWNGENIVVDEDSRTITFSEDLTIAFKQALLKAAEEENGFTMMKTIDYRDVPVSAFQSSYARSSFMNLVQESGIIVMREASRNYFYACRPFHGPHSISLVKESTTSDGCYTYFYDTELWVNYYFQSSNFNIQYVDDNGYSSFKTFKSFDEGTPLTDDTGLSHVIYARMFNTYTSLDYSSIAKSYSYVFYSTDGRKIKVFNSLNALKNYTVGNRSVYFGSGFYDDPGEITVSFDELEKYIDGKYDDFFKDLKDLIGDDEDKLTEEDLEKLVDKILDKMDDIGDNNKPGDNTDDNNSLLDNISGILEGITDTISSYLDAILLYLQSILTDLDYIVMELQELPEEEAKQKTDSVLSELQGTFSEVGDMMTKKFPFCIPWDLKQLYITLNGGKEYSPESPAMLSDGGSPPSVPSASPYKSNGKLVDVVVYSSPASRASPASDYGIMTLADDNSGNTDVPVADAGVYPSESGAPVFHIPFVIKSAGINAALMIDMSPFDGVSDISRTLFLLLFLYQLILLSIRITEFLEGFIG